MSWLASLFMALVVASAWGGPNGTFGAPTYEDYKKLSFAEIKLYEDRLSVLGDPRFVSVSHAPSPSFYGTARGARELREMAAVIGDLIPQHQRVVFIGRSGTGLMAYLSALSGGTAPLTDVPFSYGNPWDKTTDAQRQGLRRHLTRNGLDPKSISMAKKPFLFFDFVYTGKGSSNLIEEVSLWASEIGISQAVKSNLHFLGFFPAEILARQNANSIYYSTLKEMQGSAGPPPSDEEIEKQASHLDLPGKMRFQEMVAQVFEKRISQNFYSYAGTHGPNAHQSFVRAIWEGDPSAEAENTFAGKSQESAFLDLFFVYRLGELDRTSQCAKKVVFHAPSVAPGEPSKVSVLSPAFQKTVRP